MNIEEKVRSSLKKILPASVAIEKISAEQPLKELGFTSLELVNFVLQLENDLDVDLVACGISVVCMQSISSIADFIERKVQLES